MAEVPTFSVVIPCYNYGRYLPFALDSVLAQKDSDIEIVLVDDASSDDTALVARRYGQHLRYIRNDRNLGAGGAWCRGLKEVRGTYVMKLDADDRLLPGCFDAAERAFEDDLRIGCVISSVLLDKEHEGIIETQIVSDQDCTLDEVEFRTRLLHSFFFRMPGCILRTAILSGHEPPDPGLYQVHDWEYFLRVTRGHSARLLREPGGIYRIHDRSITATAQFDNRLYRDIRHWLEIASRPGERHLDEGELRILHGSCAELMLIGFGPKLDPRSYARYFSKYLKAVKLSARGGMRQFARLHFALMARIWNKLARLFRSVNRPHTVSRSLRPD